MIVTALRSCAASRSLLLNRTGSVTRTHFHGNIIASYRSIHATPIALKKKSSKHAEKQQVAEVEDEDDSPPVKKGKSKGVLAADLTPASKSKVSPEARAECDKASAKMTASIEWYRKEVAALENRAQGRVTPAILDSVRVHIGTGEEEAIVKLMEVATVGMKEGTVLVVTVFDEHNLKAVEKAIYAASIPQVVPQKIDSRTIRIPMPKPTVEGKESFIKEGSKEAENTKKKIRAAREASAKHLTKMGFDKWSAELKEMQTLTDKSIEEVDKILQRLKSV
ncbi:hypothetical protein FRB93_006877 [Tulasnella sp. JGI-2019a]|nr:hypothetical protein FRB93_006877 [Tulasnella sp. JGI-2019a]